MDLIASLLHLGGYGAYVWPAYGVAAAVLIGLLWWTVHALRADERLLARLQTQAPRGAPRHAPGTGSPHRDPAH